MKYLFFILCFCASGTLLADSEPTQAIFKSVVGVVKVRTNHKWIKAEKDLTVVEGQRIMASDNSTAVLKLFDGSELTIAANTEFTLTALQKPSADSKVIKFKLIWGQLSALVQKLTTANSSFEIESGGVVCGVRGTQFSMFNNGAAKPQVVVQVTSGSVYTIDGLGNHFIVQPGGSMKFVNGAKVDMGSAGNSNNTGNKKTTGNTGNGGTGSGSSNGSSGASSTGGSAGTGNPPPSGGDTGSNNVPGSGLADLNHQFQSNVLINNDNTITNPTVQQALQLNVNLTVGK